MKRMKDFTPFHKVIKERATNPNANHYEIPWWDAEIKQFTLDIDTSIQFIREECSDEEFWWLGEIFDDLMEATGSVELLNSIRERVERVSNAEWKKDILECIQTAAEYVED